MPLAFFQKCFSGAKRVEIGNLRKMVFDESSTDVEKRDEKYLTALHLAAKHGQDDCVEELLKRGANPNRHVYESCEY
jgi:ankyrin repeat protein